MIEKPLKNLNDFVLLEKFLRKTTEEEEEKGETISHDINIRSKKFFIKILGRNQKKPLDLLQKNNIVLERKKEGFTAYWKEGENIKSQDIRLEDADEFKRHLKNSNKLHSTSDIAFVEYIAKHCGYTIPAKYKKRWFEKVPDEKNDFLTGSQEVFVNELKRLLYPKQMKSRTAGKKESEIHILSQEVQGESFLKIITDYQQQKKSRELDEKLQAGKIKGLGFLTLLGQFFKDIDLKFSNIFAISNKKIDNDLTEEEEFDLVAIDSGCNLLMGNKKNCLPFFGRPIYIKSEIPKDLEQYAGSYIFLKNTKEILYVAIVKDQTNKDHFKIDKEFLEVKNKPAFDEFINAAREIQDKKISLQQDKALNETNHYSKMAWELIVESKKPENEKIKKENKHGRNSLRNMPITKKSLEDLPSPTHSGEYNWLNFINGGIEKLGNNFKKTPLFLKEQNQAILRILMLPQILTKFINEYTFNKEATDRYNKLIERINELKQAALQTLDFCKYLRSSEAKAEFEDYLDHHLLTFVTVAKNNLVEEKDRSEVRANFLKSLSCLQAERNEIDKENNIKKEKKRKLAEDWPKGCPKFFKKEFDVSMQELLEKKEDEKMSCYLENESIFFNSFEEYEGRKKYFDEDIMDIAKNFK